VSLEGFTSTTHLQFSSCALFLNAFGVSLRKQEEKASGTAKAALQAWYKNHVKPSCGKKKKKKARRTKTT